MKYISLNWTLALKFSIRKKRENARLPNTYGARLYIYIYIHLKKCPGKCKIQGNISQLVSIHLI